MKYVITGTSSGLGFALAMRLVNYGHVIGVSRSIGMSKVLLSETNFSYIEHDLSVVSCSESCNELVDKLKRALGDDVFTIVFNAASFHSGQNRLNVHELARIFDINLFSAMNLLRDLQLKGLRRILFVNSVSGIIGQDLQHEYVASKHALMGYARSISKSAKHSNYDVMSINPGGMKTALWKNHRDIDCSDFLEPQVVADVCIALLTIPQRTFIDNMVILPPCDV